MRERKEIQEMLRAVARLQGRSCTYGHFMLPVCIFGRIIVPAAPPSQHPTY